MALTRIRILSPNYSSRGGAQVRLIVLHTAEGSRTYQSLGSFFANPASQVSSHTGIDDTPNTIGEYVNRTSKAWTAANANPVAVQTELCAFAAWDLATWNQHPVMLENTAKWIAEEAEYFRIPIVRLSASQAQTNGIGVCRHMDLGSWGGNHVDPGNSFPIDAVLDMARGVRPPPPPPPEVDMNSFGCTFTTDNNQQQVFGIDAGGNMLHWYFVPSRPWVKESLGAGWDKDSELVAYKYNTTWQVWGRRADGRRSQIYWSGTRWITQDLP